MQPPTVKNLLYAYRSGLTGIHLLRTGECVGDVTRLAPIYGFAKVPELVARKASGKEHGALGEATALTLISAGSSSCSRRRSRRHRFRLRRRTWKR
jgi:hypothetical protein